MQPIVQQPIQQLIQQPMQQVIVQTASHDYPIKIITNADFAKEIYPFIKGQHILIVTNDVVAPLYLQQFLDSLEKHNDSDQFIIKQIVLPDGEEYKHQQSINQIYDELLAHHFSRDCTLIALGGGVIGDMTGFAAASYMRGVNFIQVPTTLLAQVDSSVGGKTGINHPQGKNMIGAFWQPQLVLADMASLKTLPPRELSAGMAEVIKYALIMDIEFLSWLEENMQAMMNLDTGILAQVVKKCCELKAQVVAEDEREGGRRAILNFGHTFGHVIETYMGYGEWLHGEAVAVGMVQACQMSQKLGWLTEKEVERVIRLIASAKLPIAPPKIPVEKSLELMSHDKKAMSGNVRLVLLEEMGKAIVTKDFPAEDFPAAVLQEVLQTS